MSNASPWRTIGKDELTRDDVDFDPIKGDATELLRCHKWEFARHDQEQIDAIAKWRGEDDSFAALLQRRLQKRLVPPIIEPFFTLWPEWPELPYQSIEGSERTNRLQRFGGKVVHWNDPAGQRLSVPIHKVCTDYGCGKTDCAAVDEDTFIVALQIDFSRSEGHVLADFKDWFTEARKRLAPHRHENPPKGQKGGREPKREHLTELKGLGAWRLMKAEGGLWKEADSLCRRLCGNETLYEPRRRSWITAVSSTEEILTQTKNWRHRR